MWELKPRQRGPTEAGQVLQTVLSQPIPGPPKNDQNNGPYTTGYTLYLGYWAIILGSLGGPGKACQSTQF